MTATTMQVTDSFNLMIKFGDRIAKVVLAAPSEEEPPRSSGPGDDAFVVVRNASASVVVRPTDVVQVGYASGAKFEIEDPDSDKAATNMLQFEPVVAAAAAASSSPAGVPYDQPIKIRLPAFGKYIGFDQSKHEVVLVGRDDAAIMTAVRKAATPSVNAESMEHVVQSRSMAQQPAAATTAPEAGSFASPPPFVFWIVGSIALAALIAVSVVLARARAGKGGKAPPPSQQQRASLPAAEEALGKMLGLVNLPVQ